MTGSILWSSLAGGFLGTLVLSTMLRAAMSTNVSPPSCASKVIVVVLSNVCAAGSSLRVSDTT